MVSLTALTAYLDDLLSVCSPTEDHSNNGLQVEGAAQVNRALFAVDASLELFERAVETDADFLFVHHGLSWGNGFRRLTGTDADRYRCLLANGISLYASHLPLDGHPEVGNNAVIGRRLGLLETAPFCEYGGCRIGIEGRLPEPMATDRFVAEVSRVLETECRVLDTAPGPVCRVGVVSGGGGSAIAECAARGIDCLLTGEIVHQHVHTARECGVRVVAAGHYRTEVWGALTVMAKLAGEFPVTCEFVDIPTGY